MPKPLSQTQKWVLRRLKRGEAATFTGRFRFDRDVVSDNTLLKTVDALERAGLVEKRFHHPNNPIAGDFYDLLITAAGRGVIEND